MDQPTRKTVREVVTLCLAWAEGYYRHSDGRATGHAPNMRHAVAPLLARYGSVPLDDLRASDYRLVQADMIASGLARSTINARMKLLRRVLRWSVSYDYCLPEVLARCSTVDPLRRGRCTARETLPVRPVLWSAVEVVLPRLVPDLRSAVAVQWWSGMRVGELLGMRVEYLTRDALVWVYRPTDHKTAHHGHERSILLGPRCREWMPNLPATGHVFRTGSGRPYTSDLYRQSIHRACDRAGVDRWTPLQLRHSAGTRFRADLGIEAARVLLGHRSCITTEIYAERDVAAAMRAAASVA